MNYCKEKLKSELEYLKSLAIDPQLSFHFRVFLVGNEFFYGDTKPQDLSSLNLEDLLSVFIGSIDIILFILLK
jgi:hypothetical protein